MGGVGAGEEGAPDRVGCGFGGPAGFDPVEHSGGRGDVVGQVDSAGGEVSECATGVAESGFAGVSAEARRVDLVRRRPRWR